MVGQVSRWDTAALCTSCGVVLAIWSSDRFTTDAPGRTELRNHRLESACDASDLRVRPCTADDLRAIDADR